MYVVEQISKNRTKVLLYMTLIFSHFCYPSTNPQCLKLVSPFAGNPTFCMLFVFLEEKCVIM